MKQVVVLLLLAVLMAGVGLALLRPGGEFHVPDQFPVLTAEEIGTAPDVRGGTEIATFGTGCFWCTEAVFQQLKGVRDVVSGYSGGRVPFPTYAQICTGETGHAEVVQITFDPAVISFPELLEVFWRSHDPTTPNRQGDDVGTQYRSAIFYHTDRQKLLAERYREKIDAAGVFAAPVVTEIAPFTEFYPAERYHQDYYANNSRQGYCRVVIAPKLDKLKTVFRDRLRSE